MTCNPVQNHDNSKWNVESHVNEKSMDLEQYERMLDTSARVRC